MGFDFRVAPFHILFRMIKADCDPCTWMETKGSYSIMLLPVHFYSLGVSSHRSLRSFWMFHRVSALFLSWATSSSFSFWLITLVNPRALRMHGRLRKTSFSIPYIPCQNKKSTERRNGIYKTMATGPEFEKRHCI